MACSLTNSIKPCPAELSLPGVQRVWLARKSNAMLFTYTNDDFGIITFILNSQGTPTPFYEFACDTAYVKSDESLSRNAKGKTFPQSVDLRFSRMSKEKRVILESIINDKVVCVYLDSNGKYWLMFQDNGAQCVDYQGTPDIDGGGNRYTCKLQGLERYMQREVNGTNFIYTSPNGGQGGNVDGTQVTNLGGSGVNGTITTILNSWQSAVPVSMPLSQLGSKPLIDIMQ
jgi:hypothetical protein